MIRARRAFKDGHIKRTSIVIMTSRISSGRLLEVPKRECLVVLHSSGITKNELIELFSYSQNLKALSVVTI
jgi:hypothetical protein